MLIGHVPNWDADFKKKCVVAQFKNILKWLFFIYKLSLNCALASMHILTKRNSCAIVINKGVITDFVFEWYQIIKPSSCRN